MKDIEDIIREKPHLADPFRFYEKTLEFIASVNGAAASAGADQGAYAREQAPGIFARFSALLGLPEGVLTPLQQAMEVGEIDFARLPHGEVPAFSLPYDEDDLFMMLYLLSRPWFLALQGKARLDERVWEEGRCPVCHARPVVTGAAEDGRRTAFCSFCRTTGYTISTGCPVCLSEDGSKQSVFRFEGEDGFSVLTCDHCRSYVKIIDAATMTRWSAEIADIASLPLDIRAQEKGYMRRAPNPIGIRKITTRG